MEAAARVALKTVYDWLENNEGVLDAVVFDVFDQPNTMCEFSAVTSIHTLTDTQILLQRTVALPHRYLVRPWKR